MMEAAVENKGAVVTHSTDPGQPGVCLPQRAFVGGASCRKSWKGRGGRVVVGFQNVVMVRFL